jgi:outer membrane protein
MPLLLCCTQLIVSAQQQPASTIPEAVERALDKYSAVRCSMEQASAAAAGINLARTSYLPRADFLGQVNRATHNNVFGQLFRQSVIPSMTGPVLGTNSGQSVWGSAVGALVSWEPIDFGLRGASVDAAKATRDRANAEVNVTKPQVAGTAADAFLTIAAAEQTVVAAKAGVERAQVLEQVIGRLAKNKLRPGADASRAQAELAVARTQQIQAEQARNVAYTALAALLNVAPETLAIESRPLLTQAPANLPEAAATQHPAALAEQSAISEVKSREKVLARSYNPRLYLEGAAFARGTGIQADGRTGEAGNALVQTFKTGRLAQLSHFPLLIGSRFTRRKKLKFTMSEVRKPNTTRFCKI